MIHWKIVAVRINGQVWRQLNSANDIKLAVLLEM